MRSIISLLATFAVVLYLASLPASAQRGGGQGGRPGGGAGGHGMQGETPRMGGPGMGSGTHPMEGQGPRTTERERAQEMPQGQPAGKMERMPEQMGKPEQAGSKPTPGELLTKNEKLSSRLGGILPAGTNLQEASAGFKNLGEFVAAAHVSHNLGIPFGDLKTRMTTGMSLGEAIRELRPNIDHQKEAQKAQKQAKKDLKDSGL